MANPHLNLLGMDGLERVRDNHDPNPISRFFSRLGKSRLRLFLERDGGDSMFNANYAPTKKDYVSAVRIISERGHYVGTSSSVMCC